MIATLEGMRAERIDALEKKIAQTQACIDQMSGTPAVTHFSAYYKCLVEQNATNRARLEALRA